MTHVQPRLGSDHGLLIARQVEALDAWNAAMHARERALGGGRRQSREERMDCSRRLHLLRRVHDAVLAATNDALARDPSPILEHIPPRVVVAHRHQWFAEKLSDALGASGIQVVAVTDNGADALGVTIAEQPELLLVGDAVTMLTPPELVAEVGLFSPTTAVVAQVPYSDDVGAMLDAGARYVVTRQIPPSDIANAMTTLLMPAPGNP